MTNAGGERAKGAPEPTFRSVGAHIWRLDGFRGLMWGRQRQYLPPLVQLLDPGRERRTWFACNFFAQSFDFRDLGSVTHELLAPARRRRRCRERSQLEIRGLTDPPQLRLVSRRRCFHFLGD